MSLSPADARAMNNITNAMAILPYFQEMCLVVKTPTPYLDKTCKNTFLKTHESSQRTTSSNTVFNTIGYLSYYYKRTKIAHHISSHNFGYFISYLMLMTV